MEKRTTKPPFDRRTQTRNARGVPKRHIACYTARVSSATLESPVAPALQRPPRKIPTWAGPAALGAYAVVAWIYLLAFPDGLPLPNLDQSWAAIVTRAGAEHWAFGQKIVTNHGPWSHLNTGLYYAPLFTTNYLFQLLSKVVMVALICRVGCALPTGPRWLFFLANLATGILDGDYTYLLVVVYAGWLVSEDRTRAGRLIGGAGVVLAAAAALMKIFYLFFGQGVFACVLARHVLRGRGRRGSWLEGLWPLGLFEACFCTNWLLAGQHLADLPAFLHGAIELTAGHSRAMGFDPTILVFLLSMALVAWHAGLGAAWFWRGPRATRLATIPLAALFAGSLFMAWKQGLTRADRFHLSGFYCFAAVFITMLPLFFDRRALAPVWHHVGILTGWVLAGTAMVLARPEQTTLLAWEVATRPAHNLSVLFNPAAERARLDTLVDALREGFAMPQTRAAAGRARIDFFGTMQGILLLNDLNYAPVPTLQGYLAFTPYLAALDARSYAPDRAPEFVLFQIESIDDRWETIDGALQLREILWNYQPVLIENHSLLLRRKPAPLCATPQPVLQQQGEIAFDTALPLPTDGADWCELEVHRTLLGRLVNFLYHEPALVLETTSDGATESSTLPPVMAQGGFLLRQPPRTAEDMGRLLAGLPVRHPVTSIRLKGNGLMHASAGETVTYRFYHLDPPHRPTNRSSAPM